MICGQMDRVHVSGLLRDMMYVPRAQIVFESTSWTCARLPPPRGTLRPGGRKGLQTLKH